METPSLPAVAIAGVIGTAVAASASISLAPLADALGILIPGWVASGLLGAVLGWLALVSAPVRLLLWSKK